MTINPIKLETEPFDVADDDVLWEQFMCFARMLIPYEEHWHELSEHQKYPIIAFIYESDVLGEGHIGFIELNSAYISFNDVIKALKMLHVSDGYIENIEKIPVDKLSVNKLIDQSKGEDDFLSQMDEMDAIFDQYDKVFYDLVEESSKIEDSILEYIRENLEDFFVLLC